MTTIACDLTHMAADTRVEDDESTYPGTKIYRFAGALVGIAGDGRAMGQFLRWMKEGEPEAIPEPLGKGNGSFKALVLKPSGIYVYYDGYWPEPVKRNYHAVGSGSTYALATMFLGQPPARAVQVACEFDSASGGEIEIAFLTEVVQVKRKGGR